MPCILSENCELNPTHLSTEEGARALERSNQSELAESKSDSSSDSKLVDEFVLVSIADHALWSSRSDIGVERAEPGREDHDGAGKEAEKSSVGRTNDCAGSIAPAVGASQLALSPESPERCRSCRH